MFRVKRKIKRVFRTARNLVLFLGILFVALTFASDKSSPLSTYFHLRKLHTSSWNLSTIEDGIEWVSRWGIWVLGTTILLLILAKLVPSYFKYRKMNRADIKVIDRMDGHDFEELLAFFFKYSGYKSKKTKGSGDFGADVVIERDRIRTIVQAKRYRNKVDGKAIQEVVAAKKYYDAEQALVVTNSYFTEAAVELDRANEVELWDRNRLIREFSKMNLKKTQESLDTKPKPN